MAISDKLTTLNGIKTDIKTAINGKGGSVGDDFTTYATAITNLPSGGGGNQDLIDLIEGDLSGSFTIPSGTTTIGIYAFFNCVGLTTVTIPNSVTSIDMYAFAYTGLTSITIPNTVTSIGMYAFAGCRYLTSVNIPSSITSLQQYTFASCTGLTSVTIPNTLTDMSNYVFAGCTGLTSVTIPNSVTSIGGNIFNSCTGLTSVTIGNSVASIGDHNFNGCTNLASITSLNTTPPTLNANAFNGVPATCAIYVPSASVEDYKAANIWSDRAAYIQAIPS